MNRYTVKPQLLPHCSMQACTKIYPEISRKRIVQVDQLDILIFSIHNCCWIMGLSLSKKPTFMPSTVIAQHWYYRSVVDNTLQQVSSLNINFLDLPAFVAKFAVKNSKSAYGKCRHNHRYIIIIIIIVIIIIVVIYYTSHIANQWIVQLHNMFITEKQAGTCKLQG